MKLLHISYLITPTLLQNHIQHDLASNDFDFNHNPTTALLFSRNETFARYWKQFTSRNRLGVA